MAYKSNLKQKLLDTIMKSTLKNLWSIQLSICILSLAACNSPASKTSTQTVMTDSESDAALQSASVFYKTIDGKQSHFYALKNKNGVEATLANYGAHLISL